MAAVQKQDLEFSPGRSNFASHRCGADRRNRHDRLALREAADVVDALTTASSQRDQEASPKHRVAFMMRRLLAILDRKADSELMLHETKGDARLIDFIGVGPSYERESPRWPDAGRSAEVEPAIPAPPLELRERISADCSPLRELGVMGARDELCTPYTVVFSEDLMDHATLESFRQRRLVPCGNADVMVSYWLCSPNRLVSLSVYRRRCQRPFGETDRATLSLMLRAVAPLADPEMSRQLDEGAATANRILQLPPRRRAVLGCLLRGMSEKEAGRELDVSVHTVHSHVKALYAEYGVESRGELMACFIDQRIRKLAM